MPVTPDPLPPISRADHARGPADARFVLVQYADYECPFARQVHEIVRDVRARFPEGVRHVVRHFPVRYHPHALGAAMAAEAVASGAGEGAFWAFHDRLFAHPLALSAGELPAHAEAVGASPEAVREALASGAHRTAVLAQKRGGVRAGVRSSMNLWIGGALYEDDDLEEALVRKVVGPLKASG